MRDLSLVCSPPHLGTTEVRVDRDEPVRVHVRVKGARAGTDVRVQLWSKADDAAEWRALDFRPRHALAPTDDDDQGHARHYDLAYAASGERSIEFTIRYKLAGDKEWTWMAAPGRNGRLLFRDDALVRTVDHAALDNLFHGYEDKVDAQTVRSTIDGTSLLVLSCRAPVMAPEYTEASLGKPKDLVQWISLERLMSFWMEPNQGREVLNTPRDSFLVAFQRRDGTHVVLLPVAGLKDDCHVVLRTSETDGNLTMFIKNDGTKEGSGRVVLGHGSTLALAVDAVFAHTKTLFQNDLGMTEEEARPQKVDPTWFEEWTDGLFYCTWNAMYTDVTEEKTLRALEGLDRQGIRVTGVIIDDGWQDIDEQRRWRSFEPIKSKFPKGLKGAVDKIKSRFPYVKHVGVWHALFGYWNAMSPDSWISDNYTMTPIEMRKITVPNGLEGMHIVDGSDVRRMYDDFYRYLAGEGITVVKCDVQAQADDISHATPDKRRVWRDYQDAFKLASMKHLQRRVIYCMSHVSNIFQYALLQQNCPPACVRNSNDFFPDQADSHAWHIFWNACNDLYTSRLNVLPDWDMFDTAHPQAFLHAMSRSLSGGPILITDQTDKSDRGLIEQMISTSITSDATKVLRFPKPAVCRYPYLNFNDGRLTKVINRSYDIFVLGAFNTTKHETREAITLADFAFDRLPKEEYVVYQYSSGRTTLAKSAQPNDILFGSELRQNGCDVYFAGARMDIASSGAVATTKTDVKSVAVLGLVDKFAGPIAVVSSILHTAGSHPVLELQLAHLGTLGIWTSWPVDVDRILVTMREIVVPRGTVSWAPSPAGPGDAVDGHESDGGGGDGAGGLLRIDTESAWSTIGGRGGGVGNEVTLKVYLR